MKRFNITNNANGLQFQATGESLEVIYPNGLPRAWGKPERWVSGFNLSDEEKASALEQRVGVGSLGEEVIEYKLPQQYTIVETDISAEIAAQEAKKARLEALKQKHKAMNDLNLTTINQLRDAILELQELIGVK